MAPIERSVDPFDDEWPPVGEIGATVLRLRAEVKRLREALGEAASDDGDTFMTIAIKLDDGRVLRVRANPDELDKAFHGAVANAVMLRIKNNDGEILAINPNRILYWTSEHGPAFSRPYWWERP